MSSEMIHALLPSFLVGTLGVSVLALGLIEGAAEATASITKLFSGALSDRWGRRKPLVVLGYGLAALSKPLFPLAHHATLAVVARLVDRVGKGIRGAPRDALVADITPPEQRGAAYGLRQSMDTAGAFIGPLIATGLMVLATLEVRTVLWVAVVPAMAAVLVLILFVREPERRATPEPGSSPSSSTGLAGMRASVRLFPARFGWLVALVAMFTLMRFSEAFLVLRAQEVGISVAYLPMTLVAMSSTYMLTAYPAGYLSDHTSRHGMLAVGCIVMVAADLLLGLAPTALGTWLGIMLWGVHMGLTEGVVSALAAEYAPADLRGSAFGILNFARGIMALLASVLAGVLWSHSGSAATFGVGAFFALVTAAMSLSLARRQPPETSSPA